MIIDKIRDIKEFIKLYYDRPMPCPYTLDFLINNPHLYCFYDEEKGFLKGFITIQREESGELTLSGVSVRKNMPDNVLGIIKICNAFNEDMFAYTPLKHAALLLKKAGFIHLQDDKYVRYSNNG